MMVSQMNYPPSQLKYGLQRAPSVNIMSPFNCLYRKGQQEYISPHKLYEVYVKCIHGKINSE